MSGWQDISTAPKDGTCVLAYGTTAGEISGPSPMKSAAIAFHAPGGDYPGFDWAVEGGDYYAVWMQPTHWMPLPEPPEASQ